MRTLAVRLDSLGDVIVTGPAVRALAASGDHITLLCGTRGRAAGELLPGVDRVLEWTAPWIDPEPAPVVAEDIEVLRSMVAAEHFDRALIFTSFHQTPLPTALVLRLAGVPWIGAISVDYPGSLLDLRLTGVPDDIPEHERALRLVRAAGYELPTGDDGLPAVAVPRGTGPVEAPYLVLHPGTSVPARAWPAERFRATAERLAERGHRVVVTGSRDEEPLTRYVADGASGSVHDLGGRLDLAELAAVLAAANCVVVGNTGPAHLAAAVGTPVVSLFAPTVPAVRWAPQGAPMRLLGDQHAPCRNTRATTCPVPGHPCLASVTPDQVVDAVERLCGHAAKEPA